MLETKLYESPTPFQKKKVIFTYFFLNCDGIKVAGKSILSLVLFLKVLSTFLDCKEIYFLFVPLTLISISHFQFLLSFSRNSHTLFIFK